MTISPQGWMFRAATSLLAILLHACATPVDRGISTTVPTEPTGSVVPPVSSNVVAGDIPELDPDGLFGATLEALERGDWMAAELALPVPAEIAPTNSPASAQAARSRMQSPIPMPTR